MSNIFDLFKKISTESESAKSAPEYIIAGLGNPGDKYTHTRHNAGFLAMDYIAQAEGAKINKLKFKSLCTTAFIAGKSVLLMKPQTFMNSSGEAIREAADFYKIPPEKIIMIFDDISLNPGMLRVKAKGTDGGHNGLKSIIPHINSSNFPRVKIGIGAKPHPEMDLADWVLGKFTDDEKKLIFDCLSGAYESAKLILDGKIEDAMAKHNRKI